MKKRILIFSKNPEATQPLVARFGDEYIVRTQSLAHTEHTVKDFRPDLICLHTDLFIDKDAALLETLQLQPGAVMVPFALFCEQISPDHRVNALKNGVVEIFMTPFPLDEIELKLARILRYEQFLAERDNLQDQLTRLSQYFSVDVVEKIMSEKGDGKVYGENLDATVFFLDVRNFTAISESLEPNLVASLLNRLYTDIMDLVLTYKGSVNKIIGDALLSTFGCPVRRENDARNAVECALAVRETIKVFNSAKPEWLTQDISIGMGIATGHVFAGTIGSYRKMDYTVIGDTVNIAARLEGLTKKTRFDLIIDENTRKLLGDSIEVRRLSLNRVRGRTQPMNIFLVDGLACEVGNAAGETIFFR